jgi:hypothetical protein
VYTVGVKARGFNKLTTYEPEHILSLSERTVNKFLKGGTLRMLDLIGHTRSHLTRAYPAATRVFSSNFLPHRFWAVGLQLVACNWQTDGTQLFLLFSLSHPSIFPCHSYNPSLSFIRNLLQIWPWNSTRHSSTRTAGRAISSSRCH